SKGRHARVEPLNVENGEIFGCESSKAHRQLLVINRHDHFRRAHHVSFRTKCATKETAGYCEYMTSGPAMGNRPELREKCDAAGSGQARVVGQIEECRLDRPHFRRHRVRVTTWRYRCFVGH